MSEPKQFCAHPPCDRRARGLGGYCRTHAGYKTQKNRELHWSSQGPRKSWWQDRLKAGSFETEEYS